MTFSDRRIVDLVKENFVAAWTCVAPVQVAVFELGDGREVSGTVGGEIALYFCRPDGVVFDILPALHSPHVTYWAIKSALDFYRATGATDEAILTYHQQRVEPMAFVAPAPPSSPWTSAELPGLDGTTVTSEAKRRLAERREGTSDPGTLALSEMVFSKTAVTTPTESITVIEPGGDQLYKQAVHIAMMAGIVQTPDEWKEYVFGTILREPLTGGERRYTVDPLQPFSVR